MDTILKLTAMSILLLIAPTVSFGAESTSQLYAKSIYQDGEGLVRQAETTLKRGQDDVKRGEALVAGGRKAATKQRQEYLDALAKSGSADDPQSLEIEIQRLRGIGRLWQRAIQDIKEGNRLIDKGNKTIATARNDIRLGRELMERGSELAINRPNTH